MTHDRLGRPLIGPCLIWTGKPTKDGYARIKNLDLKTEAPQLVHRVAYALAHGIALEDLKTVPELDHLCRVHECSSARHLEPVTRKENLERGDGNQNKNKTHCVRNHEFTEANTIWRKSGSRGCRTCKRERWRERHAPDLVGRDPLTPVQMGQRRWSRE